MKKSILFFALLCLAFSCTKENPEQGTPVSAASWNNKIFGTKAGASPSSILVKLAKVEDAAALSDFSGVESVEALFPSTPGNEELERRFGLDRWMRVSVKGGSDNAALAAAIASSDISAVVEFDSYNQETFSEPLPSVDVFPESTKAGALEGFFDDPYLGMQWHYYNDGSKKFSNTAVAGADVNVLPVWEQLKIFGDPDIVVAVVDEGVRFDHPDLAANMWTNAGEVPGDGIDNDGNGYIDDIHGFNFVVGGEISWDRSGDTGHASHCAGTIAAVNNNGIGVCGVAGGSGKNDGCRIMSCQIFSGNAGGTTSVTANAIKYAADNGASVISCSFGYSVPFSSDNAYLNSMGTVESDAIHYFEAHGGNNSVLKDGNIAIFSSGNESHNFAHYPGALYDIISVSAIGPDFLPTTYTNYGPGCNIAAPGGEYNQIDTFASLVLSTVPSCTTQHFDGKEGTGFDYGYMQGTSMACPHVSGVVALALSYAKRQGKTYTRDEFKQMVLSSTNDVDQRIAGTQSKSYVNTNVIIGGEKYYVPAPAPLQMAPFYHNMGTGAIDAWRLMMNIDGTPVIEATPGKKQWVDLSPVLGSSAVSLTYLKVDVPESAVKELGLQKLSPKKSGGVNGDPVPAGECYAYEQFGRLYIHPTKVGSAKISISVVGGGSIIGGGDNPPGGMPVVREFSVISRNGKSENGGWL